MLITFNLSLSICFFLKPFRGRVGIDITGFGTGCFSFNLSMDGLVLKLPVLGRVAVLFAFQFEVFGRGQVKTL